MNSSVAPRKRSEPPKRAYESPLRKQQADETRERILETFAEQMADPAATDFSIPDVAKRAGVSVRTVYRHFPTRDALLDGLAAFIDARVGRRYPRAPAELAETAEALFPIFDEHATLIEAQLKTAAGRSVRKAARKKRAEAVRRSLDEVTRGLDPDEVRGAAAVIKVLLSSDAWSAMKQDFDLDGVKSGKAVAWAIRTLVRDLEHRSRQSRDR